MRPEGFSRRLRLRYRSEFVRIQTYGKKHHTRHFLVFVSSRASLGRVLPQLEHDATTRIGVTVTRKVGGAVARNRIKRHVREAFRRTRTAFPPGIDMVWVAKHNAGTAEYVEVCSEMAALARKPGLTDGASQTTTS